MSISTQPFEANGRTYQPAAKPIVVICIDGSAEEYLDTTMSFDRMPNLKQMAKNGYRGMVRGALPSFTNVNNSSIVTGVSPAVHGISGTANSDICPANSPVRAQLTHHQSRPGTGQLVGSVHDCGGYRGPGYGATPC